MVTKPGDFHQNRNMKYDNFRTNKYEFVWNPKKIRKAEHTVRHNHAHGPTGRKNDWNQTLTLTSSCFHWSQWLDISASIRNQSSRAPFWRIHTSLQGWKPSQTRQCPFRCNKICANTSQHWNKQCLWWFLSSTLIFGHWLSWLRFILWHKSYNSKVIPNDKNRISIYSG